MMNKIVIKIAEIITSVFGKVLQSLCRIAIMYIFYNNADTQAIPNSDNEHESIFSSFRNYC